MSSLLNVGCLVTFNSFFRPNEEKKEKPFEIDGAQAVIVDIRVHHEPGLLKAFPGGKSYYIRFVGESNSFTWCRGDELEKI